MIIFWSYRVADFSLRTAEAHEIGGGVNKEILTYLQTTYAIGFISMGQTLLGLTRCLLVNALKGESARTDEELQQITPRSDGASDRPSTKPDDVPVNPEVAYRSRVLWAGGFILQAHYFAVIGLGAVAGGIYYDAITQSGKAREVQVLRCVCCLGAYTGDGIDIKTPCRYLAAGMALVLLQLTGLAAIVGAYLDRNVSRRKTLFIVVNILLLVSAQLLACPGHIIDEIPPCAVHGCGVPTCGHAFPDGRFGFHRSRLIE